MSNPAYDICVRICAARGAPEPSTADTRRYDALLYTLLPLGIRQSSQRRVPEEWLGLPLQGIGQLQISWDRYQDYLASFQGGDKAALEMRRRMRRAASPELLQTVDRIMAARELCNVWWGSEAPELDDMPWELLFTSEQQQPDSACLTFVRGVPPQTPPPILPVAGPLRLLWCDAPFTPAWMRDLFTHETLPGIQTIPLHGPLREGLTRAAEEGIELLHVCSDGVVSLAYEGLLYLHGEQRQLSANEISASLRGSRVSFIGLTEQDYENSDSIPIAGREVASAYRAFACLSSARVPLPSIMAPLGPVRQDAARSFWRAFYTELGKTHRLGGSLIQARLAAPSSTFAMFLRHPLGRLFRVAQGEPSEGRPERLATDLGNSRDVAQSLDALREKYGELPEYLTRFVAAEGERQKSLEASLFAWGRPEEDEL